jgi:hypothetical protein
LDFRIVGALRLERCEREEKYGNEELQNIGDFFVIRTAGNLMDRAKRRKCWFLWYD